MLVIYDGRDRLDYWRAFWERIGRDADAISSPDIYPLYPADKYIDRPGMFVLDAGVGMGRVMKHYRNRGHRVVGMDYEPECIARLKAEDQAFEVYAGTVNDLPEDNATYDAVLAFGTLSNMDDPRKALREFFRVLKPGGLLVASVTNDNIARRLVAGLQHLRTGREHFSMVAYTPEEWRGMLADAGFRIQEMAPVVTRIPLYQFFPFLRRKGAMVDDAHKARNADAGIELNPLGEFVFKAAFRWLPFTISHGVVGVAFKP